VTEFQQAKMWLVETLHLSKDVLHIYVALIVFFGTCLLFRWRASQWKPWLCVLAAALAGEAWDIRDSIAQEGQIFVLASLKDLANTMLLPTLLLAFTRYSVIFTRTPKTGPSPADRAAN